MTFITPKKKVYSAKISSVGFLRLDLIFESSPRGLSFSLTGAELGFLRDSNTIVLIAMSPRTTVETTVGSKLILLFEGTRTGAGKGSSILDSADPIPVFFELYLSE
jgi:hypothetical protein